MLRGQSAAQQPMLAQSLKGVAFTTVGAQYLCMHVVVVGTPGRSTTLNMGRCQVKTGGLVNDTTPVTALSPFISVIIFVNMKDKD